MFTTAPLFGKFHSPLKAAGRTLRRRPLHHLESLCAQRIDPRLLQPNATGDNSRQRIYTPRLTFLAFLDQTLDPNSSCRSAVDQILAYYQALPHPPPIDPDTSAYCQARALDLRRVDRHPPGSGPRPCHPRRHAPCRHPGPTRPQGHRWHRLQPPRHGGQPPALPTLG